LVLAIEPLDKLMVQFPWKRNFVESPALDAYVDFQRMGIRGCVP